MSKLSNKVTEILRCDLRLIDLMETMLNFAIQLEKEYDEKFAAIRL